MELILEDHDKSEKWNFSEQFRNLHNQMSLLKSNHDREYMEKGIRRN